MSFDEWFNSLRLSRLFAITAILFLFFGFVMGFMAGQELEFSHRQNEIEKASLSEWGLIRFENDYYRVEKQSMDMLLNSSEITNLTVYEVK